MEFFRSLLARIIGAFMILKGDALPVPLYDDDTTIVVIETDGSKISFVSCKSFVESDSSYNILLAKIILWVCSKNRFFWTSDQLGSQLKSVSDEYYEEHKNKK